MLTRLAFAAIFLFCFVQYSKADYCIIKFWDDAGMSGQSAEFYGNVPNLAQTRYWPDDRYPIPRDPNDTFSSMEIVSGEWLICHDAGYVMCGSPRGPGVSVANFDGDEWQDTISSVKLVKCDSSVGAKGGDAPAANCTVSNTNLLPSNVGAAMQMINNGSCKQPRS